MKFFRINVSGTKFFLSEKNILSDSPNIFTERFAQELLGGNKKKSFVSLRMAVDKNPEIFNYIHRHLQGYNNDFSQMSSADKEDLLEDAKYYKLYKLQRDLETHLRGDYMPLINQSVYTSDDDDEDPYGGDIELGLMNTPLLDNHSETEQVNNELHDQQSSYLDSMLQEYYQVDKGYFWEPPAYTDAVYKKNV